MQMRTTLMQSGGGTSMGRDASAIGTTAAIGASIGAIADGGFGAGIGAAAGAAAATIGVLVTRGRPAVVYPEDVLTFRLEAPLILSVESSQQAFQPVTQGDYEQKSFYRPPTTPGPPPPRTLITTEVTILPTSTGPVSTFIRALVISTAAATIVVATTMAVTMAVATAMAATAMVGTPMVGTLVITS